MTTRIMIGDCLESLRSLPEESVHTCITSPPYFGLRDYGTASWDGGDPGCKHSCGGQVQDNKAPGAIQTGVRPGCDATVCKKCGAVRVDKQIGLEKTPEEYIKKMVEVFREVKRVLRDDGVCFINIGDSYNGSGGAGGDYGPGGLKEGQPKYPGRKISTLKPKDLIGIPWMLAFALRDDGWYLRSEIIWHKPNPMPESVTDRPTKSHEQVFLLTKGQWSTRIIETSNLGDECCHFFNNGWLESSNSWASTVGIKLATTILDFAQSHVSTTDYQTKLIGNT